MSERATDYLQKIGQARRSRRGFIGLTASGTAALIASEIGLGKINASQNESFKKPSISIEAPPRWNEGTWSETDVGTIAEMMVRQKDTLYTVQDMGKYLQANIKGQPSISLLSNLFSDKDVNNEPVKLEFALEPNPNLDETSTVQQLTYVPVTAFFQEKKIINQREIARSTTQNLNYKKISIDSDVVSSYSDIAMQFLVARSLLYAWALGEATSFYNREGSFSIDQKPDVELYPMRVNSPKQSDIAEGPIHFDIPIAQMADMWSSFQLVPSYLNARNAGLIPDTEMGPFLYLDAYAKYFKNTGKIVQNSADVFAWSENRNDLNKSWRDAGIKLFKQKIYPGETPPYAEQRFRKTNT